MLHKEAPPARSARVSRALATDLPVVKADPTQIRQVVMNLISNAAEATRESSGLITVRTGAMEADREYLSGTYLGPEVPERSYVYLEVSDTGCGRARSIVLSPLLARTLHDLLSQRRREVLTYGWGEVPSWVFCSETGGLLDQRNVNRSWYRLRRRAQKEGVGPLKLHCARHTSASLALASRKSVRWVASQLGHSNPGLTLRIYAHALREEEEDLSFLDFGGTERHPDGTTLRPISTVGILSLPPLRLARARRLKLGMNQGAVS